MEKWIPLHTTNNNIIEMMIILRKDFAKLDDYGLREIELGIIREAKVSIFLDFQ